VKSDGLEADEVVAAWDGSWDRASPGAVVLDHDTVTPDTVVHGSANQTSLV
jgi:hypothetical protein